MKSADDDTIILQFIRGEKNCLGDYWHRSMAEDAYLRLKQRVAELEKRPRV